MHRTGHYQYNLPLRLAGWILRGIFLFLLVLIPVHLLLKTFQVSLPLDWLFPLLSRLLLIALACFLLGGFWSAFSGR